ncbi:glycoside hydrolase family 13 protein [Babjeviella inositovora NRRL Y-12698]|uniref:1,4-alpha-glucan-branching enzyme n=1 Tax=Babjeviella inositovora NRRL Y-12698 TaxID=984486 RepID=A0A1E3QT59_9ASCO|nr:glycoside hydrolase family 13 protein [Babjeviella inositovora NRRL Y-12698]ODQ80896.1 glycoside hydrolase family 13 protein [Babjeviella inositovora NRRL Y-12698]
MSGSPLVQGALDIDPYLTPYAADLLSRTTKANAWLETFTSTEGGILNVANSYTTYGLHADDATKTISYKEWAPNATAAALVGDFNDWDGTRHLMQKDAYGCFNVRIAPVAGDFAIAHDSRVKVRLTLPDGSTVDRLPAWISRATQPDATRTTDLVYEARFWNPEPAARYTFRHERPHIASAPKIYEAHVGISSPDPKVALYDEFTDNILPLIHKLGYNTIQLMAVMEHAYYASFGYQVTNFFAVSSRYGTPEQLKRLVDTAHGLGIRVLLDVVHSHASKNVADGLNRFDGSDHQYFHDGAKGDHPLWDSKIFNYGSYEVLRFLLSNLRYYIDEFRFDGFRFDGVTLMLYHHHGAGEKGGFSGGYHEYFNPDVDEDAVVYLMLANQLVRELGARDDSQYLTIAEDVSGMPTLCLARNIGGVGFDFRLAMALPDMWIKLLKTTQDQDWDMGAIVHTLTNRRWREPVIAYAELHDQALVGDKTLAFWLMDAQMYTHMSVLSELTPVVDRGMALHKMIRGITHGLGGEGYLNFEGNEFGHPEWLDFPRVGNGDSYHYARRQFNLVRDDLLRYKFLWRFDAALQHLDTKYDYLGSDSTYVSLKNENDKVIAFERNGLLFVLNFHPTESFVDYRIGVNVPGVYQVVLNSDAEEFGGHARVSAETEYFTTDMEWNGRANFVQIYLPSRVMLVFSKVRD